MELQQLRYFLVVANLQHVTRAADEIHIAQPALTQTIRRLENEFGVRLFERSGRNVALTEAGKTLQKLAAHIVEEADNLPLAVQESARERDRTIRINISASNLLITDGILAYKKSHPEAVLELSRHVGNEHCDFSVTSLPYDSPTPKNSLTLSEEILVALPRSDAIGKESISLRELKNKPTLSIDRTKPLYRICEDFCKRAGFLPNIVFECDSPEAIKELIGAGLGVCFWPAFSWGAADEEKIRLLHVEDFVCKRKILLTQYSSPEFPLHADFRKFLYGYLLARSKG